jgi:hypothetical protein
LLSPLSVGLEWCFDEEATVDFVHSKIAIFLGSEITIFLVSEFVLSGKLIVHNKRQLIMLKGFINDT